MCVFFFFVKYLNIELLGLRNEKPMDFDYPFFFTSRYNFTLLKYLTIYFINWCKSLHSYAWSHDNVSQ